METETKTTKQWVISIVLFLAIAFIIVFLFKQCYNGSVNAHQKEKKDPYLYETTEVLRGKYIRALDSIKGIKPIKPLIIERWLSPDPIVIDSAKIIGDYLRLVVNKKGSSEFELKETPPETLTILSDFIYNYPRNPKLVGMKLDKDTLSLDLFDYTGKLTSSIFPLYLDDYNYKYSDGRLDLIPEGELLTYPIAPTSKKVLFPKQKLRWNNLYLNGGYDFYTKAPTSSLEYNLSPGRFKLDLDAKVIILQEPQLNLNAKLGYRLFK